MISMTGFACGEWADENICVYVEIKGYNSRFLDIYVNTPPWFSFVEPDVRRIISGICERGKVEVYIRIKEKNEQVNVSVNVNAAKAYMQAFTDISSSLGLDDKPGLSLLASMESVLEIDKPRETDRLWNIICPIVTETSKKFREDREREGEYAKDEIYKFIEQIEAGLKIIEKNILSLENNIKENIKSRFNELAQGSIDENRILAETAMLLMKYTISEEISRLSVHLVEFKKEACENKRLGKKLEFLCQEISREINTIGSKSNILEVTQTVVEMKEALENIREQLRNIE